MIVPKRAFVRPRVTSPASGETILLEEEVRRLLDARASGSIALVGEAGTGKTTALQHLAAVLPTEAHVLPVDEHGLEGINTAEPMQLVIYAARKVQGSPPQATYRLARWDDDDLIEYLLAAHKDRCASVMARLRRSDRSLCQGLPDLWGIVLDQLAL